MTSTDHLLTTRNASIADLAMLLRTQHAAKLDVVAPARHLAVDHGRLRLIGVGEPSITPDGVTVGETLLRPTAVADAGIAEKLGIPLPYLRRMRAESRVVSGRAAAMACEAHPRHELGGLLQRLVAGFAQLAEGGAQGPTGD